MNNLFIIVLWREETQSPYVYHTNKRFHETPNWFRGCKVVEYKSRKRAEQVACTCCSTHNYGKSYAMTRQTYLNICEAIKFVYDRKERKAIFERIIENEK